MTASVESSFRSFSDNGNHGRGDLKKGRLVQPQMFVGQSLAEVIDPNFEIELLVSLPVLLKIESQKLESGAL